MLTHKATRSGTYSLQNPATMAILHESSNTELCDLPARIDA
ncbi:protein of unknown function [Denitratisoma oestradiolicum]|uniref:Uncharacterized protein n=1 Tax=Denitratisoma oestradiolicum TaxID=311182 RepID=A0A6S6XT17_9PROT|nr:protein of unknown function [Denitratisoma oestradiolicum]